MFIYCSTCMEEESKVVNIVQNIKQTPARLIKTVTHYGTDLLNCLNWAVDDVWEIKEKRREKRKNLFWEDKTQYQKALNMPIYWWVYAVSQAEKIVKPGWRLIQNVGISTKNFTKNLWNSIWETFSTEPISNFTFSDSKLTQERPDTENKPFFDPSKPWTNNRWNRTKKSRWKLNKNPTESQVETKVPATTAMEWHEIDDSDRVSNEIPEGIELSNRWKLMVNYIKESHPELTIEFDDSTTRWHVKWPKSGNKIIVWSKKKEDVQQILYHEITHVMINDEVKWIQELINSIKEINQKKWKQLFKVSTHKHYDTPEKKTVEDTCELLALYSTGDWKFDKYMKKLHYGDDKRLAKIEKSEAKHLKELCKNVMSWLKTVNLDKNKLIDMAS